MIPALFATTFGWAAARRSTLLALLVVAGVDRLSAADDIGYNRDIRPILSENCFSCHGPDSASRQADLRLDRREAAVEAGAIVPGKPDDSPLVQRILSDDPEERMPPPDSHKVLTPAQRELLRSWVAAGAEYQPHWSFIAPRRPPLPAVRQADWVRNPIDAFLLAQLERQGLAPAPEADRRTLARRLSLDLVGLPPLPEDVEAFVNDPAPDYYEKFVDKLLASRHWGEHRARSWLDAARYADTHGLHFDNYREMWAYRDWVIEAFNRNLRFDQFTLEQLAGDLLPGASLDQLVASGFNRCNISTNEGGTIPEENLVLYTRDRTETTAQVWLGLTAGCAVCHDHKFDPLSQREFYQLAAFFNNSTHGALDGNIKDTPPVVSVPSLEDRPRFQSLAGELAASRKQLAARREAARSAFESWQAQAGAAAPQVPQAELRLLAGLSEGEGTQTRLSVNGQPRDVPLAAGSSWDQGHVAAKACKTASGSALELADVGDFDHHEAFSCGAWIKLAQLNQSGAIVARMDDQNDYRGWDLWCENGRIGAHVIHKWQQDAIKVVSQAPITADRWTHVLISYDGSGKAAGLRVYINGAPQPTQVSADGLKNTIRTAVPLKVGQRHQAQPLAGLTIQDLRIYGRSLSAEEAGQLAQATRVAWLAARPAAERSPAEQAELFDWWLSTQDQEFVRASGQIAALEQEQAQLLAAGTKAHVMTERDTPATAFVLFRGEYDKRRDQVSAGTPQLLPPMPAELPRSRLGFARWLLLADHPLTARVTVNRFWQEVFGTGIVRTAGDFGISGELPSHPELLDWLAVEFQSDWDVQRLFRLLVTSAAYRQASLATPEKLEKDPANRLLSRGPRFRMDAEMIRDYALAASGLLVPKVGGPSVKPYQPDGVWEAVAMMESNTRYYQRESGERLYRRSLYTFWKRAAPPASMDALNAPSREFCTVRRERTNTPLQALVTLNDPQFVEAARHLAQSVLLLPDLDDPARLDRLARRVLARPLRPEESPIVQASLQGLLEHYQAHPQQAQELLAVGESKPAASLDASRLAGWTMLANQMLNLDEVLNK